MWQTRGSRFRTETVPASEVRSLKAPSAGRHGTTAVVPTVTLWMKTRKLVCDMRQDARLTRLYAERSWLKFVSLGRHQKDSLSSFWSTKSSSRSCRHVTAHSCTTDSSCKPHTHTHILNSNRTGLCNQRSISPCSRYTKFIFSQESKRKCPSRETCSLATPAGASEAWSD